MSTCPCCGQTVERPSFTSVGNALRLSRRERLIFERLARASGSWVTRDQLADATFVDQADGGPDDADACVRQAVKMLRRKLSGSGVEIDTIMGCAGGDRRLVWALSHQGAARTREDNSAVIHTRLR